MTCKIQLPHCGRNAAERRLLTRSCHLLLLWHTIQRQCTETTRIETLQHKCNAHELHTYTTCSLHFLQYRIILTSMTPLKVIGLSFYLSYFNRPIRAVHCWWRCWLIDQRFLLVLCGDEWWEEGTTYPWYYCSQLWYEYQINTNWIKWTLCSIWVW